MKSISANIHSSSRRNGTSMQDGLVGLTASTPQAAEALILQPIAGAMRRVALTVDALGGSNKVLTAAFILKYGVLGVWV